MGYTEYYDSPRDGAKAELDRLMTGENSKVLDSAIVRFREYYAAVEQTSPDGLRSVFAVVCIGNFTGRGNFGYKDMCESMGPYYYNCPERILDLLTPTDEAAYGYAGSADEWRAKCREVLAVRKTQRGAGQKLAHGQKVNVTYSIGGKPYTEATVFKQSVTRNKRDGSSRTTARVLFQTPDGTLFRLQNWKRRLAEPGAVA